MEKEKCKELLYHVKDYLEMVVDQRDNLLFTEPYDPDLHIQGKMEADADIDAILGGCSLFLSPEGRSILKRVKSIDVSNGYDSYVDLYDELADGLSKHMNVENQPHGPRKADLRLGVNKYKIDLHNKRGLRRLK